MKPYNVYKNESKPEQPRRDDAFERACEASALGERGDATAYPRLESTVLTADGGWSEEGAFTDRIELVWDHAAGALAALAGRVDPRPEDLARWRELLSERIPTGGRYLALFAALGARVCAIVEDARASSDPLARMRAIVILGTEAGFRPAIEHEDEEVRCTALENAEPGVVNLHYDAMRRYPRESSGRVRRAIAAIWVSTSERMGTLLSEKEVAAFLADEDPSVVELVSRRVEAYRREQKIR